MRSILPPIRILLLLLAALQSCSPLNFSIGRRPFIYGGVPALIATATSTPSLALASDTGASAPTITHKVFFDVRIARADGTFATRDDDPDPVFRSRLVFGLYGDSAPSHVLQFLKYVDVPAPKTMEEPSSPSYASSLFSAVDSETGLIVGGKIKGLEVRSEARRGATIMLCEQPLLCDLLRSPLTLSLSLIAVAVAGGEL